MIARNHYNRANLGEGEGIFDLDSANEIRKIYSAAALADVGLLLFDRARVGVSWTEGTMPSAISPAFQVRSSEWGLPQPTVRMLSAHAKLEPNDLEALEKAFTPFQAAATGDVVFGAKQGGPFMVVSGWAALERTTAGGSRQIITFFLAGDIVGLDMATTPRQPSQIKALTPLRLRRLTPDGRQTLAVTPNVVHALAAQSLRHQAWLQDQVFRLGALSALERTAHLLVELSTRLELAGESVAAQALPLKQELLADALGLSLVHVNRTLKRL